MSIKLIFSRITDPIYLTYELLLSNRRLIIPTMIGLTIALTVISQNSMLVESYRPEIFEEVVFSYQNLINEDIRTTIYPDKFQFLPGFDFPNFFTNFNLYDDLFNKSLLRTDYSDYILDQIWYSRINTNIWLNLSWNGPSYELITKYLYTYSCSNPELYFQLEQIMQDEGTGRLPENSSEILFIIPDVLQNLWAFEKDFENLTLNTEINITLPEYWDSEGTIRDNKTVTIVGLLKYDPTWYIYDVDNSNGLTFQDNSANVSFLIEKYLDTSSYYSFITFPTFLNQTLNDLSVHPSGVRWEGRIIGKTFLDPRNFDAFNINAEKAKLKKFLIFFEESLNAQQYDGYVRSDLLYRIQMYEGSLLGLLLILLLVSFPVICIALFLVTYSFGLIRRQKQEQIGIIKTRGGSWFQIFTILTGEMVISTIIAVFIGFILSIFLSDVVLRSTNFLEFLGNPIPVQFSRKMLENLIFWGLLIALFLNFTRIIRMSRQKITETLIPVETQNPLWKRYYIDIIIFIIGTATWLILIALIRMASSGEDIGGFYLIFMIVSLLGIPAPFLIFFGTIMVIARFFPFLIKKLSEILWRLEGGINAFAIRNIVRHKQAANRAVLLITLAISFSILASSLIFSLDETKQSNLYYEHGADITLDAEGFHNNTIISLLKKNVTDITRVSCVYSADYYSSGAVWRDYRFLFLDPTTYAQTAFFKPSYKLSNTLANLMTRISDNKTIILFKGNFKNDVSNFELGDNLSIYFSNGTFSEMKNFKIGGTFNLWPMIYPESWYDPTNHYWLIGSLDMFQKLNQSGYLTNIQGKYLAKLESQTNIENTLEKIYNITKLTPNSPAFDYIKYKDDFSRHFSLSILNTDLIICVTVSIIGVIMFAFFTYVERGKEIGVERALGMTQFQTAMSFLVEASTILAFGTVIGFFTGTYFVAMFLQITQIGEMIPPIVVTYPIPLLMQILLVILTIAAIGTIIPAYMATRKDISQILKVE